MKHRMYKLPSIFQNLIQERRCLAVCFNILLLVLVSVSFMGCTAKRHRLKADKTALAIIEKKQEEVLGKSDEFSIERPSDILRRRLLTEQELAMSGKGSLGTDALDKIRHWPEKNYPAATKSSEIKVEIPENGKPPLINFTQALQIAAENSFDYQTQKENLFRSALTLDLSRNEYDFKIDVSGDTSISVDKSRADTVKGLEHSGKLSLSKTLKDGSRLAANLALNLVDLLTQEKFSASGILGDASISIPLLRGSKTYIYSENLTQAERNVVYAVYDFERYKKTFAVNVATNYFQVLRQIDQMNNSAENYKITIASARRTRRLADAGRITEIEVDQAVQRELSARNRWISSKEQFKNRMDSFKQLLGLPPDASIELDRSELDKLISYISKIVPTTGGEDVSETGGEIPAADALIELKEPDRSNAGPMEVDERKAIELGLQNRLDFKVSEGKIYDAQRAVIIKADALGTELTFLGQGRSGSSRSLGTAGMDDARLEPSKGFYSAILSIDLPFERTSERKAYRESYISYESAVRNFQKLEDNIKLSVRQSLRSMSEAREGLKIQNRAVAVAEKRVDSTTLFFEAGRAQIRDLLEAQESLLTARNSLTSAVIDYRVAELEFQQNTGLLEIDKEGLLLEYSPEDKNNAE
ncbi:TolC family protein [Thermodesulfobacteriota bacterium]